MKNLEKPKENQGFSRISVFARHDRICQKTIRRCFDYTWHAQASQFGARNGQLGDQDAQFCAKDGQIGAQDEQLGAQDDQLGAQDGQLGAQDGQPGAQDGRLCVLAGSIWLPRRSPTLNLRRCLLRTSWSALPASIPHVHCSIDSAQAIPRSCQPTQTPTLSLSMSLQRAPWYVLSASVLHGS